MRFEACVICGTRSARYVCQECGRRICEICFDPQRWGCSDCYKNRKPQAQALKKLEWPTSFKLFFLGFFFILIGTMLIAIAAVLSGETAAVGIYVWPIPIIFGWSYSIWTMILAVALTLLGIVVFILWRKRAV